MKFSLAIILCIGFLIGVSASIFPAEYKPLHPDYEPDSTHTDSSVTEIDSLTLNAPNTNSASTEDISSSVDDESDSPMGTYNDESDSPVGTYNDDPDTSPELSHEAGENPNTPQPISLDRLLDSVVRISGSYIEEDRWSIDDEEDWSGSGFVMSFGDISDTVILVLTNRHVLMLQELADADYGSDPEVKEYKLEVIFPSGRRIEPSSFLISTDHDLAFLVIDATGMNIGDDYLVSEINPDIDFSEGDEVIAVGFPLEQNYPSMTSGIISAFFDERYHKYAQTPIIQHDASINSGSSGGPLFLKNGNDYWLIGVNTGTPESRSITGGDMSFAVNLPSIISSGDLFDGKSIDNIIHVDNDITTISAMMPTLNEVGYENMDPVVGFLIGARFGFAAALLIFALWQEAFGE